MDVDINTLKSVFAEAAAMNAGPEREAYLTEACGDDAVLRGRVDALLKAHDEAGGFMASPDAADDSDRSAADTMDTTSQPFDVDGAGPHGGFDALTEKAGTVIDRYKLLQKIGEGGFGVVYMAEQEEPVKRRVALKIIKAGMDTRAVIARFEAERQALAMMDHPNIARVLDAGATDTGRPFFVMELVKGIPITDYCDQANLDTRHRLELFKDVCSAVQHAHQKGIIHRDLKPSNIMITLRDDRPNVKVIDFGIAKATEQKLTEKTLFTNYGQMIGTPTYMSPEQAVMSEFDVDTRSDIYSLGVLLYELLTGSPPFDINTLRSAGYDEMRRIIREQEPPKPSTRLSTFAADVKLTVAAKRHVSPAALSKQLHGDLDWIVMKALEKDRTRRYESASAFAQDINRHLDAEPVSAAAPSAAYRLRKFVRRNKAPMAVAATIALLLIAGTAFSAFQAVRATAAENEALAALEEKNEAIKEKDHALEQKSIALDEKDHALVQTKLALEQREKALKQKDSAIAAAEAALAAKAAEERAKLVAQQNQMAAIEQARKRLAQVEKANEILGSIFKDISPRKIADSGRPLQAILVEKLDEAVAKLDGDAIGDPLVVARMQGNLGVSLRALGEPAKAIVLLEKTRATFEAELGAKDPATLRAKYQLGAAYLAGGRLREAVTLDEQTLKLQKDILGPEHSDTMATMAELADAHRALGHLEKSTDLLEQTLKLRKQTLGPKNVSTITTMNNLANSFAAQGKYDLAVPLLEEALTLLKEALGPEHPDTLATMGNLVSAYFGNSQLEESITIGEKALKLYRARLGPDHPGTLMCMNNLAITYQYVGKLDEAVALFEQVHNAHRIKHGPEHPQTLHSAGNLAAAYWRMKRLDKSIPLFEESLRLQVAGLGPNHPHTLQTKINLGVNYRDAGRYEAAIPLLEEGYRAAEKLPQFRWVIAALLITYARAGEEEKFADLLNGMEAEARRSLPKESPPLGAFCVYLGRALIDAEVYADAERLLREALAIQKKTPPNEWAAIHTATLLGEALIGQKKYAEAEPLLIAGDEWMTQNETAIPRQDRSRPTAVLEGLVTLYETRNAAGDAEKADRYRRRLQDRRHDAQNK